MRIGPAIAAIAVVLVAALVVTRAAYQAPSSDVELLGIAAPERLSPGERDAVFGGLKLAQGEYEVGLWNCDVGTCIRSSNLRLTGPSTSWLWLGAETAPHTQGTVVLRVYKVEFPLVRLVGEWSHHVSTE